MWKRTFIRREYLREEFIVYVDHLSIVEEGVVPQQVGEMDLQLLPENDQMEFRGCLLWPAWSPLKLALGEFRAWLLCSACRPRKNA
jgi:hypothetical protein